MTSTLNGVDVLDLELSFPRAGRWTVDVDVQGDVASKLTGDLVLDLDGVTWRGRAWRTPRHFAGRTSVFMVGGKNGLWKHLDPKFYLGCSAKLPLDDIFLASEESLSTTTSLAFLGYHLNRWTRIEGTAGSALQLLVNHIGGVWRVLPDGTIWIGQETWPAVDPKTFGELLNEDPLEATETYATTKASLQPGVTVNGRRVSHVEYSLSRTVVSYESETAQFQRERGSLEALVRNEIQGLRYFGKYAGEVVKEASGRLDIKLDETTIPRPSSVVVRHGLPGVSVVGVVGRRCNVGFEDGDPSRPYVADWAEGGTAKLGTVLVVQNASSMAIIAVQWFAAGTAGDAAADAAQAAALLAGNTAFKVPVTAGIVAVT